MPGYLAIIERDETCGYSAWAPDLPGVVAAASSYDECVLLMREAIEFHLDGLRQDGEPGPGSGRRWCGNHRRGLTPRG